MATDKRQFTLRLQDATFEKVKEIAVRDKRSIAMQVEFILEKYIEEYETQNGPLFTESTLTIAANRTDEKTDSIPDHSEKEVREALALYRNRHKK